MPLLINFEVPLFFILFELALNLLDKTPLTKSDIFFNLLLIFIFYHFLNLFITVFRTIPNVIYELVIILLTNILFLDDESCSIEKMWVLFLEGVTLGAGIKHNFFDLVFINTCVQLNIRCLFRLNFQ